MHVCKRASPELEPYITLRLTGRVLSAASQVCLERLRLRHLLTRLYHVTRMYVYMCVGTVYSIGSNSEFVLTRELRVRINGHHHTLHVCTGTVTTVRSARRGCGGRRSVRWQVTVYAWIRAYGPGGFWLVSIHLHSDVFDVEPQANRLVNRCDSSPSPSPSPSHLHLIGSMGGPRISMRLLYCTDVRREQQKAGCPSP